MVNRLEITGHATVFMKEVEKGRLYSTYISNKNIDGTYEKMYLTIQLPRETILEDKTEIDITKGFLTFYKDKNGLPKVKMVIQEFTESNDEEIYYDNGGSDLPF